MASNGPHAETVTPDAIMQLGFGFWGSKTLLSAVEIGLFTLLASGPMTLEQVRAKLGLHQRSARDFLDALVALGMLRRDEGRYSNTPATQKFLDRNSPAYVGGVLEMCSHRLYRFWSDLTEGLKTGEPQNEAKVGGDIFDQLYKDPARLEEFLSAMTGLSTGIAHALSNRLPWDDIRTFVDVGTAQGAIPAVLAKNHPKLRGVGADLPVVKPIFEKYIRAQGLQDRVSFQTVNFFNDALPTADVIIMGHILHDWDLPTKQMLVRKAHEALPKGGRFVVFEAIIDDDRRTNAFGLLMSLNMLIETRGGFDYTGADCQGWMREAGFRETRVEHLCGPDSMVIGTK